ncbi:MAG: ABC transporter substrate-binding protein [Eubacteriales bacterium]|nr:ABC transporter substrate-binding protein [Eubacteriales bacterium]
MKRLICLILSLLLLTGCGKSETEQPEEEKLIVVGISQVGAESDWRVANSESMKSVFTEERDYRLLFEDARQIQENQIIAVRRFIQQRVDYIVLMPLSETGWDSVLQEAWDAGIPVILVDRMVDVEDDSLYAAHVGSDFYAQGRKAVTWMERKFRNSSEAVNIVHIQGTPGSTAQLGRTNALEDGLTAHENWNLLARLDGDFTQAKTYEVMSRYLGTLPPEQGIDVVYCENDNEAFGAIEALERYGYQCGTDVNVICFDATRNALKLCMEGKIALTVECNPLLGPLVEEIIQTMEAGQIPQKQHYIEEKQFTSRNLTQQIIDSREY